MARCSLRVFELQELMLESVVRRSSPQRRERRGERLDELVGEG